MSSLQDKLAAFREAAGAHGVQINVHASQPERPPRKLIDRVVLYGAFAGVVSAAAVCLALKPPDLVFVDASTHHHYRAGAAASDLPSEQGLPVPRSDRPPELADGTAAAQPSDPWQTQELRELRERLNYVEVSFAGRRTLTLDGASRVALSKWAAGQHRLNQQGLSWKDLYGTIQAETDWIARDGLGKNSVASTGIAQLEPTTANALGVTDPKDPIQAVHAAASLLKEAAAWSRAKVAHLPAHLRATALRDGLSVYYNLSTRGRGAWNGENVADLPIETQQHIRNARQGVKNAAYIETQVLRAEDRIQRVAMQTHGDSGARAVLAARLDGAPAQGSLTEPDAAKPNAAPMQFSSQRSLDTLRTLLERPCARVLPPQTIVQYNSACMFADRKPTDPAGLPRAVPGAMLVGYFDRVPVVVLPDPAAAAEAARLPNQPEQFDPNQPAGFDIIVLTSGMVERLAHNPAALEFILAHENGHHRLDHRALGNNHILGAGLMQEQDADYSAFQHMNAQGRSPAEIAAAADLVFEVLRESPVVQELPILRKALAARQTEVARHTAIALEVRADLNMTLQGERVRMAQK